MYEKYEKLKEEGLMPFRITSAGVSDYQNWLRVAILPFNDENIEWYKKNMSDAEFIVFERGGIAEATEEVTVKPTKPTPTLSSENILIYKDTTFKNSNIGYIIILFLLFLSFVFILIKKK